MNIRFYSISLSLVTALGFSQAFAVKAKPGVVEYTQPDGSVVEIMLHGDERFHYATDAEGWLVIPNSDGEYEYAVADAQNRPVLSGVSILKSASLVRGKLIYGDEYSLLSAHQDLKVSKFNIESRGGARAVGTGEPKYRYSTSVFPTIGQPHSLVILVEYPDFGFNVENPVEYYNDFLNGEDFIRDGGTGSCRQYYIENSSGQFKPTFDVYGPVPLKNDRKYYGGGLEDNACQMVVEAVKYLDDIVDFSQYDHNGDGYVDSVYIIYSDKGEADGGPRESVWPYSWELEEENIYLTADGVKFNIYGCSNELKSNDTMDGIGTFTHEFGHVLGLPDLYNTDNTGDYNTPGNWSLMDNGSYNNGSRTPCNLSSFERYSLGWLAPSEIVKSGNYTLDELASSNHAYIMTSDQKKDEFFIMEYRKLEGWDRYLPASGMLIWHIDFVQKEWDENTPNNNRKHNYVDLVRADDSKTLSTVAGDPFPGSEGVTSFGINTSPALKTWNGNPLNVTSISDIHEDGGRICFSAMLTEERPDAGVEDLIEDGTLEIRGNAIHANNGRHQIYDVSGRMVGIVSPHNPIFLDDGIYLIGTRKVMIRK